MPLSSLREHPRNPKDHDLGAIAESFSSFGFVDPIILDETTNTVVAGHGRKRTLEAKWHQRERPPARIKTDPVTGEWLVPVVRGIGFPDDKKRDGFLIASNRLVMLGGFLQHELVDFLRGLAEQAALAGTGYDGDDVDAMVKRLAEEASYATQYDPPASEAVLAPPVGDGAAEGAPAVHTRVGVVPPEPGAGPMPGGMPDQWTPVDLAPTAAEAREVFQLREDAVFDSDNEWGIPSLRTDRLSTETPTVAYRKTDHGPSGAGYMVLWHGSSPDDWRGSIPGFYLFDQEFEGIWQHAPRMSYKLWTLGVRDIISPDFSAWAADPKVVWLWQQYRNRWVTRYWQEVGMRVIPNFNRFPTLEATRDYAYLGMPAHVPVGCTQLRTIDDPVVEARVRDCLEWALTAHQVDTLLCYCSRERFDQCAPWLEPLVGSLQRIVTFNEQIQRAKAASREARKATQRRGSMDPEPGATVPPADAPPSIS